MNDLLNWNNVPKMPNLKHSTKKWNCKSVGSQSVNANWEGGSEEGKENYLFFAQGGKSKSRTPLAFVRNPPTVNLRTSNRLFDDKRGLIIELDERVMSGLRLSDNCRRYNFETRETRNASSSH